MSVQRAEASGGERLVDGGVAVNPGVALGHSPGIRRQQFGESGIDQRRECRAAAMMDQTGDRGEMMVAKTGEPVVGPGPVRLGQIPGSDPLPEHGIADGTNPGRRQQGHIVRAIVVPRPSHLIEEPGTDPIDGTLHAAPEFQWTHRDSDPLETAHAPTLAGGLIGGG
jgi:hypothetical protein